MSYISNSELEEIKKENAANEILNRNMYFYKDEGDRYARADKGIAQLVIKNEIASINNGSHGFVTFKGGNAIVGPLHITRTPDDIRLSQFWKFNDELLTCLPSTMYTPLPVLVYDPPDMAKRFSKFASILQV